jgi:D-glycero-D-manno-heptose 1,7-bisphosphate phosphatase
MVAHRAVFLDRDGVLVRPVEQRAPRTLQEFSFFPDAADGVKRLKDAGFLVIVVTNQPDITRELVTWETMRFMNSKLLKLGVDAVEICPHTSEDECSCRKPSPEMILDAAEDWNIDLGKSWMVGDRDSDVEAGLAAGCTTILIAPSSRARAHFTASSFADAVNRILGASQCA